MQASLAQLSPQLSAGQSLAQLSAGQLSAAPGSSATPQSRLRVFKLGGSLWDLPDLPVKLLRVITATGSYPNELAVNDTAVNDTVVIVTGGGVAVDELRQWGARYPQLDDRFCHDWALQQMTANARLLQRCLTVPTSLAAELATALPAIPSGTLTALCSALSGENERVSQRPANLEETGEPNGISPPRIVLLDAFEYARRCERDINTRIPATWEISSDSIAAHVAWNWRADELVLLKSVDLPGGERPVVDQPQNQSPGNIPGSEFPMIATNMDWSAVSAAGMVDAAFAGYAAKLGPTPIRWINLRRT